MIAKVSVNDWSGGSGRMVWGVKSLCHSLLVDGELKKFTQRNLQGFGNLVNHGSSDVIFSPFNASDLLTGISNAKTQFLLRHFSSQSQLSHPVSQGIQKIFVYHILHIQVWRFKKQCKSPCMGYFYVFDYFWQKKKRLIM